MRLQEREVLSSTRIIPSQKLLEVILASRELECKVIQLIRIAQGLRMEITNCLLPIPSIQKGGHTMNVISPVLVM